MEKKQKTVSTPPLEPVVIITDEDEEHDYAVKIEDEEDPLCCTTIEYEEENLKVVEPEVTIIPIRKKPQIRIRLKDFLPSRNVQLKPRLTNRSPRTPVRVVSPEEAKRVSETYPHRKSLPLEKCPICMKFFRRMKTHLMKHQMINRDPDDPLTCHLCRKPFNSHSNLQIHMRTHTGDKPYVCAVCSKGFAQSCNLVNHMRVHTGEKPFKCPHCDKAFTQSGNLNNHIRLHTNDYPFKCHFCDKAFVQSGNLNSHIKNNHKFEHEFSSIPDHLQ